MRNQPRIRELMQAVLNADVVAERAFVEERFEDCHDGQAALGHALVALRDELDREIAEVRTECPDFDERMTARAQA